MSDIFGTQSFEPSVPSNAKAPMFDPPAADNGGKKPRKKRTARKPPGDAAPVASAEVAQPPKKRGRPAASAVGAEAGRPRKAPDKKATPPAEGVDINLLLGATIGLDQNEVQFVVSVLTALQGNPKKSRAKITAALGRIFT